MNRIIIINGIPYVCPKTYKNKKKREGSKIPSLF